MSKVLNSVVGIWKVVARYPAAAAAIANIVVVLGASFGLHFSVDQLATTAAIVAGVFGVLVHAGVIPVTKIQNVAAGVKPIKTGTAAMLSVPMAGEVKSAKLADPVRYPFGNPGSKEGN